MEDINDRMLYLYINDIVYYCNFYNVCVLGYWSVVMENPKTWVHAQANITLPGSWFERADSASFL